jgi:hypothetical protein
LDKSVVKLCCLAGRRWEVDETLKRELAATPACLSSGADRNQVLKHGTLREGTIAANRQQQFGRISLVVISVLGSSIELVVIGVDHVPVKELLEEITDCIQYFTENV